MMRSALLCMTAFFGLALSSCIFDPDKPSTEKPPEDQQNYVKVPIQEREGVLNNMEVSYNRRQVGKYEEILDENFTMFFAQGDISNGTAPEQWGRSDEVAANTHLFDVNYTDTDPSDGIQPRCLKIFLNVKWENGVTWQAVTPPSAPDETWYLATVFFDFQFDVEPDLHLVNNTGSKAQFTVRNAGTDEAPDWKLVEFRDLDQ